MILCFFGEGNVERKINSAEQWDIWHQIKYGAFGDVSQPAPVITAPGAD